MGDHEPFDEAEEGSTEPPPPEMAYAPPVNADTFEYPPNPLMDELLRTYDFPADRSIKIVPEDEE